MARHHGPVYRDRGGDDDHPDRRAGRTHVADRAVGDVRHGLRAGDGHDGDRDGGVGELHEPDLASCEHPRDGPWRLPFRRLPQGRRTADHRRLHRGDDIVALLLAVAAGLIHRLRKSSRDTSRGNCRRRRGALARARRAQLVK